MKKCSKCKLTKELDCFTKKKNSKNYNSWCKECMRNLSKERYKNEKEHLIPLIKKSINKRKEEMTNFLLGLLKSGECKDCGNTDPRVLEWDHVKGKKLGDISALRRNRVSKKKIEEELEKCELVCANCHRIRTYERDNSYRVVAGMGVNPSNPGL